MAIVYSADIKTARMTATMDACANGTLEIQTASDAVLVTLGLDAAGGSVTGDAWTLAFDAATVEATGAGTAAKAVIKDSGGNVEVSGLTVGTSGSDINLVNTNIAVGQDVGLTSAVITHAA